MLDARGLHVMTIVFGAGFFAIFFEQEEMTDRALGFSLPGDTAEHHRLNPLAEARTTCTRQCRRPSGSSRCGPR